MLCCLIFYGNCDIFCFKCKGLFEIFFVINVFTVTLDQLDASLLNKSINFLKKTPNLSMVVYNQV